MTPRAALTAAVAAVIVASAAASSGCAPGWQDAEITSVEVGPDDRTLQVGWHCHPDASVDVEENADEVRLTFRLYDQMQGDCADVETVQLRRPLGDRRLVDAATGATLEQG